MQRYLGWEVMPNTEISFRIRGASLPANELTPTMATAPTVGRLSLQRFGRAPRIRKNLKFDRDHRLPIPHVKVTTREFAPSRLEEHYHTTLADDLMYMTYKHEPEGTRKAPRQIRLKFDPEDPYSRFRHNPPVGGSQLGKKPAPPSTPESTVRLEKIQIHTFIKDSLQNKGNLLGPLMMLRALTGETEKGGGHHAVGGVEIVKGKKSVGGWIRPGVPVGAKVDLRGQSMYDFLNTLTEFVLPRLRDFNGIVLPPKSSSVNTPSAVSGVVSFGLPPSAMVFFPQIEVNVDAYPQLPGIHIHFVTNARGVGAQDKARALVSGFQIPFIRR
jgi:large subunit ribosomal protein L5